MVTPGFLRVIENHLEYQSLGHGCICLIFCPEVWPTAGGVCLPHSCQISGLLGFCLWGPSPVWLPTKFLTQLPVTVIPHRESRVPISILPCCNKWLHTQWFTQYKFIILLCYRLKPWLECPQTKIKVLRICFSFWGAQQSLPPLSVLLQAARPLWLTGPVHGADLCLYILPFQGPGSHTGMTWLIQDTSFQISQLAGLHISATLICFCQHVKLRICRFQA